MKYIFEVNIFTDNDFGFQFVPCGMWYDGDCEYTFEKSYDNIDKAIKDITNICTFLKEQIHTSRDYVLEDWHEHVDRFVRRLNAMDKTDPRRIEVHMGGNYDGTELIFKAESQRFNCMFNVTDEEYDMIQKNVNHVTCGDVKKVVMDLFKQ